jgi:hypothetical protein
VLQVDKGKILLGGALADPVDSALFVWKDASVEVRPLACVLLHYHQKVNQCSTLYMRVTLVSSMMAFLAFNPWWDPTVSAFRVDAS